MSVEQEILLEKRALRARLRAALAGMSDAERRAASRAACQRVAQTAEFLSAREVMMYLPMPGELDCMQLIEQALTLRKIVCVPVVDWTNGGMLPARIDGLDDAGFTTDAHGVRVPREIKTHEITRLDLVIVPGLGFDAQGGRLGRGGGFYDRFLPQLPAMTPIIGLAFERQMAREIPTFPHDARVGLVATDMRLIEV